VPLANAALAVLAGLKREGARVFPVSNMAMTMALRRMDRGGVTVHGFRSTLAKKSAHGSKRSTEIRARSTSSSTPIFISIMLAATR
jgi:hypothetical protein